MANIPGVSGYIQPGAFARDRVVSRGVSIPGGIRVLGILGEGSREETLVESALGGGQDGVASPSGEIDGRHFQLPLAPVVSGRTELRLNDSLLFGKQEKLTGTLSSRFDYRIDVQTGKIELRGASFSDFDGKEFSASSSNIGLGVIKKLILLDKGAESETFTLRCSTVVKDPVGAAIPGRSKFTLTGSENGVSRDSNGNQILFTDTYKTSTSASIKRNNNLEGGLVLASTSESGLFTTSFGASAATLVNSSGTAITSGTTLFVKVLDGEGSDPVVTTDDEPLHERILVGDSLIITEQGNSTLSEFKIEKITKSSGFTTLTLNKPISYDATGSSEEIDVWSIKCFDAITMTGASIAGSDVGKFIRISSGDAEGDYTVSKVQSDHNIVRVVSYNDSDSSFPVISSDITSLTVELLETDGAVAVGLEKHASVGFEVGDRFTFKINSLSLSENDRLEAKFIYELDLNDPEFFISSADLFKKHGTASLENNLSIGSEIAFENGAPGLLAVQTKPCLPRRTSVTILEEEDSDGLGGYKGSTTVPEADDLTFIIPTPSAEGIRSGKPNSDTSVNIFVIRDGKETQIFPNKETFYNSQFEDDSGREDFVTGSDYSYSYTITNYGVDVSLSGASGSLSISQDDATEGIFVSSEVNFNSEHVGQKLTIKSGNDGSQILSLSSDIGAHLFASNATHELEILRVVDDNTVVVENSEDSSEDFTGSLTEIQFLVVGSSSSSDYASLLIHEDLVKSGAIKSGDGIKVSYIDNNDADFYDTNYFDALQRLEAFDCQMIVALPKQNKSAIFRSVVRHCELMSSIAKRKERVAFIGAFDGITEDALLGNKLVAAEDIGVVEGIQGDDPEEVLNQNVEDLQNYKLSDNFDSKYAVYMYPEKIVRSIRGTNTFLDGFYMCAAAAGYLSSQQNVAIPLTNKALSGFSILRDRVFRDVTLNALGGEGATVVQPVSGGGIVLAGRTTSQSGLIEDEEISIIFIRNRVKYILRQSLSSYIGKIQDDNTFTAITVKVKSIMQALVGQNVIEKVGPIKVERDKVDPRQINVVLSFVPTYPINYAFIDIEVGL